MSGKHNRLRGRRRTAARLRAVRSPGADLARLRGPFLAWLADQGLPADVDGAALWSDVVATVDLAADRAGLTELSTWTPDQVTALAAVADDDRVDALPALPLLLAFLGETGRWSGTPDELDAVLQVAERATSPMAAVLDELAGVTVDPTAEQAALRALPLVTRAETLLRFVLPRRPVTGTGALRRADVIALAGRLGLDLPTSRPRSMWDVPGLAALWQAALDAGLLVVTPAEATLTSLAHGWLSGDVDQGAKARAELVTAYLTVVLNAPQARPWLPPPLTMLLPVLAAAALDRPVPTERLVNPAAALDGMTGVPGEVAAFAELAAVPAHTLAHQLEDDGILAITDTVSTTPGLRGLLARLAGTLLAAVEPAGPDLPEPDPALAGQTYRLRVELADASPPVWREVLVDPNLPLDELHDVVQRLFAWEDDHLHEFTAVGPGRRTTRFASSDPFGDDWGSAEDRAQHESTVRLGSLIGPRRGELRYRYDFGDDWEHRITVVGSEPAEGSALPRCVAGAGAAPEEDSGGVWGWADKVQAAGDPRHPEHHDVRDWLGLDDGETLDPVAFDLAEVEARLAELRSTSLPPGRPAGNA
ncbi:plasmid pRiA4b ORF-3 family protein [Geodermatophilus sp. DF01-2]|uniref:plasmid pRiA4b ORF-3 family protein n=1 Tax=Geodermatophilus sp. DF01-2 TaxID=2559610 RepID=UPI0010737E35|nr:plasmid pRiA4b ORF-3 family protein [Geodermatophilus sp. DF01_2]TFV64694.1 plasmid pRiA4b ORF-3 family protein [Geodermatophilus sp. DF01_2]